MAFSQCTIIVLLSGRGSNLKSLIASREHFEILAVISDKADAPGLSIAEEAKIKTERFPRPMYNSLMEQKEALYSFIREVNPDFVVLAGYMQIVAPSFVNDFKGRILNIHPSLLPLLGGLHTHDRAIAERHSTHGCSVHIVDDGVDTGPLIAQASVPVLPGDEPDVLAARVLKEEHKLYPWVINNLGSGEIRIKNQGSRIEYSEKAVQSASQLGFKLFA